MNWMGLSTSFQELVGDGDNENLRILDRLFFKENLSCFWMVKKHIFLLTFSKIVHPLWFLKKSYHMN